jgi:hypothetical protein
MKIMKKSLSLIMFCLLWIAATQAQTPLAMWSFPTGTSSDALPNSASVNNVTKAITAEGGVGAIDFSKNGATTKAAQATGWNNGKDTKYWQIEINSVGYENLLLSSKVSTGGTYAGPRDFKIQYKLGSAGIWTDIDSTDFKTANDWTTGALNAIELPGECDKQPSVFIRWIMTSDTANDGFVVLSTGICKIDDIIVTGETATGIDIINSESAFQVYPNPSTGNFTIITKSQAAKFEIYNSFGQKVYECLKPADQVNVDLSAFGKGMYILRSENKTIQKIMVK